MCRASAPYHENLQAKNAVNASSCRFESCSRHSCRFGGMADALDWMFSRLARWCGTSLAFLRKCSILQGPCALPRELTNQKVSAGYHKVPAITLLKLAQGFLCA